MKNFAVAIFGITLSTLLFGIEDRTLDQGFYQLEKLNRGIVAVKNNTGVYIGWRLLGTDNPNTAFNVYRDSVRINDAPIVNSTNFVDASGKETSLYFVRPIVEGIEISPSEATGVISDGYINIETTPPASENVFYTAGDTTVGDADGDGQYELFVKWDPSNARDSSQAGTTSNVFIDAYRLSGERLWRIDLGPNIRAGAHYTQQLVYDFDGDGKAEFVVKTAPGSRDGSGRFLSLGPASSTDHSIQLGDNEGRVLSGPEYLTIFSGLTGKELSTIDFPIPRGNPCAWGDCYGNRVDRFNSTMGFVTDDGKPSILVQRGYYTRLAIAALSWDGKDLKQIRSWDSNQGTAYASAGNHSLMMANVDADKPHEVIPGPSTLDDKGTRLCNTDYGHGDALHITDLVPTRPGVEVFQPHESGTSPVWTLRDGATCEILQQGPVLGIDQGRGVAADILGSSPGAEFWTNPNGMTDSLYSATSGEAVGPVPDSANFLIWWDSDLSRELMNGSRVKSFEESGIGKIEFDARDCSSINGTKATPNLSADSMGDWREEIVPRCGNALRVFTTTHLSENRIYTLMHDPQYREQVSAQQSSYNQPPHPSFHIGDGMSTPPLPDIHVR